MVPAADFDISEYTVEMSNLRSGRVAATGTYQGLGPYGTYDMAGNVREWIANRADGDLSYPGGIVAIAELSVFKPRGAVTVRPLGHERIPMRSEPRTLPAAAEGTVDRITRDFGAHKPVSDDVFRAYTLLYAYEKTPLNAQDEGVAKKTEDWREEKVTFDAAYNGERMAAYLFLPKQVKLSAVPNDAVLSERAGFISAAGQRRTVRCEVLRLHPAVGAGGAVSGCRDVCEQRLLPRKLSSNQAL